MHEFKYLMLCNVVARFFLVAHLICLIIYAFSTLYIYWPAYIIALAMLFLIGVDLVYVWKGREGRCWKWFCPSALVYIAGALLALVPLKHHQLKSIQKRDMYCFAEAEPNHHKIYLGEISISIPVGKTEMVDILEQTTYVVLIISRWFLLKERVHSDRALHVVILLVAVVSDIMELFLLFQEPKVIATELVRCVVIAAWGWSLLQFVFVVSDTRGGDTQKDDDQGGCCGSYTSDIIGLLATLIFMDGPFLGVRLYVSITLHVFNHRLIFYLLKNIFVVVVALYRLVRVCCRINE